MMIKKSWMTFALFTFVFAPVAAAALPAPGSAKDMHRAMEALEAAVSALTGGPSTAVANVDVSLRGTGLNWHQGTAPDRPMRIDYHIRHFIDWTADEMGLLQALSGPTFENEVGAVRPLASGDQAHLAAVALSPHAVVRLLLRAPESLFVVRDEAAGLTVAGMLYDVLVALDLDDGSLPIRLTYRYNDPFEGDTTRVFEYSDYASYDGLEMPTTVQRLDAGRKVFALSVDAFRVAGVRPTWVERAGRLTRAPAPAESEPRISRFTDGVYLVEFGDSFLYRSVLVDNGEGLLMLDAPQSIGDGRLLRDAIQQSVGRPLTGIALSHHHADHSAGVAALAFDGAQLVTTPGNARWAELLMRARRSIAGIPAAAPDIVIVEDSLDLGRLTAFDTGPSGHADEHLVFYMPDSRAIFQSDMVIFNSEGVASPMEAACALITLVDSERLDVETVLGSHGSLGSMMALRHALDQDERCAI